MNRSTVKKLLMGLAALNSFALPAFAAETAAQASALDLTAFRASALGGFQAGVTANTFTGQLGWTPRYNLGSNLGVGAIAAASLFKSGFDSRFVVLEGQALVSYTLSPIVLEAGGGAQTWLGQGMTSPMVSGNVAWMPATPWFGLIDRVVGGYSYLLSSAAKAHEIKLGVGIAL